MSPFPTLRNWNCGLQAIWAAALLLADPAARSSAVVIRVPADQPTIQAGIDAAVDGDTVLVADGTYTGAGNRDLDYDGKAIVLQSENGWRACIIDCQGNGSDPHCAFYFHGGEGMLAVLDGFTIQGGYAAYGGQRSGGAIEIVSASPTIINNLIQSNKDFSYGPGGGAIYCGGGSLALIANNVITDNEGYSAGGGICCDRSSPGIINNRITRNISFVGGGIALFASSSRLAGNTIVDNEAQPDLQGGSFAGGGVFCADGSSVEISDSIVWGNSLPQIAVGYVGYPPSTLAISFSDVLGGKAAVDVGEGCTLEWGEGMLDADPLFVSGAEGPHFLSQVAAGQTLDSPCLDAGDPQAELIEGTTRTDGGPDAGILDMGFHQRSFAGPYLVAGPGPASANSPIVRVFRPQADARAAAEFSAYGTPHYGVNVSSGDVGGNDRGEILTGPGPGAVFGPHVRGFRIDGTPLPGLSFLAYGTNRYGVNVAAGDLDGDGFDEIVTGAGPGAVFGPHVRAFNYDGTPPVTPVPGVSFLAYGTHQWGVNVAAGDIDGDGFDEIVTGPGGGAAFGPHVRGWNVDGAAAAAIPGVSFLAYGTQRYGVVVTCGDLDRDGIDEMVTSPGPSVQFTAHIRGWNFDGTSVSPLPGCDFLAWAPGEARFGARVFAGADLDGDWRDDLVVGAGPDPQVESPVKVYRYWGMTMTFWFSLEAFPVGYARGTNLAGGRF